MKLRILVAFVLYLIGISKIIDWFVFWENNKELALRDYGQLKLKFISRFPTLMQPLFSKNPEPATVICIIFFIVAGIIFLKDPKFIFKAFAITAFLFAFWNLFSLM
jgi:hypothetical protein